MIADTFKYNDKFEVGLFMELTRRDSICLRSRHGQCEIQLLSGDITTLAMEDKVDIIMTSAFPGDYSVAHTRTLVAALWRVHNLNVGSLASDMDLDLRKHFSCWLSKPLPENLPYRRLVCFERPYLSKSTVEDQIRDTYRAFMPLFNNQDTTVISPLLATGSQSADKCRVLLSMVDGACHWIMAGLPLRCLKLVLFERQGAVHTKDDINVIQLFMQLKKLWKTKERKKQANVIVYDIYLTYSVADMKWALLIEKFLQARDCSLKVCVKKYQHNQSLVWQDEIFQAMVNCKRIIALISPSYLRDLECLEEFSMALCCTRHSAEIMAPFYIETVNNMPSYMGLVQYIDCRIRKDGDMIEAKLAKSCSSLTINDPASRLSANASRDDQEYYDVFISYSHRETQQAEHLLDLLQQMDDSLKIFFDRSELTAGKSWQQTLYWALDVSRCVVSLISPAYLASTVCQEEYSIALTRCMAKGDAMKFVPVCISDLGDVENCYSQIKMIDARGSTFESTIGTVGRRIVDWINGATTGLGVTPPQKMTLNMDQVCIEKRHQEVMSTYDIIKDELVTKASLPECIYDASHEGIDDVVYSYSQDDVRFVGFLHQLILTKNELFKSNLDLNEVQHRQSLEKARKVVIFLSKKYTETQSLMEELHIALCRNRTSKDGNVVYIIHTTMLPSKPIFIHLLPCELDMTDPVWITLSQKCKLSKKRVNVASDGLRGMYKCRMNHYLAISKACMDITQGLSRKKSSKASDSVNVCILNPVRHSSSSVSTIASDQYLIKLSGSEEITVDKSSLHNGIAGTSKGAMDQVLLPPIVQGRLAENNEVSVLSPSRPDSSETSGDNKVSVLSPNKPGSPETSGEQKTEVLETDEHVVHDTTIIGADNSPADEHVREEEKESVSLPDRSQSSPPMEDPVEDLLDQLILSDASGEQQRIESVPGDPDEHQELLDALDAICVQDTKTAAEDAQNTDMKPAMGDTQNTETTADTGDTENTETTADMGGTENTETTADTGDTQNTATTADMGDTQNTDTTADTGGTQKTEMTADAGGTQNTETAAKSNADTQSTGREQNGDKLTEVEESSSISQPPESHGNDAHDTSTLDEVYGTQNMSTAQNDTRQDMAPVVRENGPDSQPAEKTRQEIPAKEQNADSETMKLIPDSDKKQKNDIKKSQQSKKNQKSSSRIKYDAVEEVSDDDEDLGRYDQRMEANRARRSFTCNIL